MTDQATNQLRSELVTAATAHQERAMAAALALPPGREEPPMWLRDACHGSTMAALYGHALAAVLRDVEDRLSPEDRGDVLSNLRTMLENGVEDENEDLGPAAAEAAR